MSARGLAWIMVGLAAAIMVLIITIPPYEHVAAGTPSTGHARWAWSWEKEKDVAVGTFKDKQTGTCYAVVWLDDGSSGSAAVSLGTVPCLAAERK